MFWENAVTLEIQGRKLLEKGDYKGAEKKFLQALKLGEDISLRNNLALVVYMGGEPERSLEILTPYIDPGSDEYCANPFSHALGAQSLVLLGEEEKAQDQLRLAVQSFEKGMAEMRKRRGELPGWQEYTVIIMRTAGLFGNHRQVFDLYRRWEKHHISWQNRYLAGVASFNLGRHARAASLWSSLENVYKLTLAMRQVALMVDIGSIPPFELEYEISSTREFMKRAEETARDEAGKKRLASNGMVRMMLLALILQSEVEEKEIDYPLEILILHGGEWGKELGLRLLKSSSVSDQVKLAVGLKLLELGVFKEDEPVRMVLDGREQLVNLKILKLSFGEDPEVDRVLKRVRKLKEKGQVEKAIALLEKLLRQNKYHINAVLVLANLYRLTEEFDKALPLLKILEETMPDDPVVLLNLAGFWLQREEIKKAHNYLEQIDPRGESKEFQEKMRYMQGEIERSKNMITPAHIAGFMSSLKEEKRLQIEKKSLSTKATLATGLKNMPATWLKGMASDYGLKTGGRRQEREKEISSYLCQTHHLKEVVKELGDEEKGLLRYLLEREGWARMSAITRKFGSMEGDEFFWNESSPNSTLGSLWSRALVLVGQATLKNRRTKIAIIPRELRQPMAELLGIFGAAGQVDKE